MKVLKLCLLATIFTLTLSLLLSCGDGADGLHGDGCTCEECLANDGTNDPEKDDTPPDDGENAPEDEKNFTYRILDFNYRTLIGLEDQPSIVNSSDMNWLIEYVTNHEELSEDAREEILGYVEGLPENFLDTSFLLICYFEPDLVEEDSLDMKIKDGDFLLDYVVKEEYSKLKYVDRQFLDWGELLIIEADKELYHEGISAKYDFQFSKVKDTAKITLEGNTPNSALFGKDAQYDLYCTKQSVLRSADGAPSDTGEDYHKDISSPELWGFSPVIGSYEELAEMLAFFGAGRTAEDELAEMGLTEEVFGSKVLIPFVTRYSPEDCDFEFLVNYCRINDEGVLELELEANEDGFPVNSIYYGTEYTLLIGYVAIDSELLEEISGIDESMISYELYFM